MAKTRPTSNCQPSPKAPPDLTPPAKAEFKRLVKALKANGRLARADQNLIVVAAETWAMYRNAAAEVAREGSVITFEHNGMTGISQHFKVWKESARLLRGLLNDLGLTPTSRNGVDGKTEEEELEF